MSINFYIKKSAKNTKPFPTQRPDYDNLEKLVCDALNGIFWEDDCQVIGSVCMKHWTEAGSERTEVSIYEVIP